VTDICLHAYEVDGDESVQWMLLVTPKAMLCHTVQHLRHQSVKMAISLHSFPVAK